MGKKKAIYRCHHHHYHHQCHFKQKSYLQFSFVKKTCQLTESYKNYEVTFHCVKNVSILLHTHGYYFWKTRQNKCMEECGKTGTPVHCWQECKMMLWKTLWYSSSKSFNRIENKGSNFYANAHNIIHNSQKMGTRLFTDIWLDKQWIYIHYICTQWSISHKKVYLYTMKCQS